ncbi:Receptor expression-enhancing protein 4 [Cyphellophora attinorum]|uniref:Receptor expression-enhancing protein 4 n=1 Tax=Cyphellophora attinorum TaxID=1664694 RepID=A0A0N0NP95_9EURO|nr:Receptor expression-enhancing protein 4 [Phialophora attinorum]KPI42279.1 Receptor expression-enhancing protein 4 [Phialophora attinorum]
MFSFVADLISSVTCIILPAYISYKALRSRDPAQSHPWLIYFTILSLVQLADSYTDFITGWIPFFGVFRLFFMLYLVLPQTQGAKVLYLDYLEPYIVHHEKQIDEFITQVHTQLQSIGFGYINTLIVLIREKVLRQQSPQPPPQQTGAGTYASYANDYLSRFLMPQARPSETQPVGGIYSALSGMAASAMAGGATQGGRSRGLDDHGDISDSLRNMSDPPSDQATSPPNESASKPQNIDLAYGSGGTSAIPKSRSSTSFVNVDHDDFQPPPPVTGSSPGSRQTSGGNWQSQAAHAAAGFFGGGDDSKQQHQQSSSSGWSAARDITAAISSVSLDIRSEDGALLCDSDHPSFPVNHNQSTAPAPPPPPPSVTLTPHEIDASFNLPEDAGGSSKGPPPYELREDPATPIPATPRIEPLARLDPRLSVSTNVREWGQLDEEVHHHGHRESVE